MSTTSSSRIALFLSGVLFMAPLACGVENNGTTSSQDDMGEVVKDMSTTSPEDQDSTTPVDMPDEGTTPDTGPDESDLSDLSDMMVPDQGSDMASPGQTTYHQDIKPLMNKYCMRCHDTGGQGPIDFSDAGTVVTLGELVLSQVESGEMPPPVADPSCRDYESSDHLSMAAADIELLKSWVADGKPLGVDDGVPARAPESAVFEGADLELRLTQPYTPTYEDARNPNNEYRCFALEHGQDKTFYITGLHPLVDQTDIVHHVVLAKLPRDKAPAETLTAQGQDCISDMSAISGGGSPTGGMLAGWAPGMEPIEFDGAGLEVKPDEVLIIQMHYYADREENMNIADQSGYAFKIADRVRNPISMYPLGTGSFTIPAGDDNYTTTDELSLPLGVTLWGVFPHMHVLGKAYDMKVEMNGQDTCLVDGPDYDFNNQVTYMFKEPVYIPGGSPISYSCTWNNSPSNPALIHNPPIDVGYGERTDEEMCFMFSYVSLGQRRN